MKNALMFCLGVWVSVANADNRKAICAITSPGSFKAKLEQPVDFTSATIAMSMDDNGKFHAPFSVSCKNGKDSFLFNYGESCQTDDVCIVQVELSSVLSCPGNTWTPIQDGCCGLRVALIGDKYEISVLSCSDSTPMNAIGGAVAIPNWSYVNDGLHRAYTYKGSLHEEPPDARQSQGGDVKAVSTCSMPASAVRHEMSREEILSLFSDSTNRVENPTPARRQGRDFSADVYVDVDTRRFAVEYIICDQKSGEKVMSGTASGVVEKNSATDTNLVIDGLATNGSERVTLRLKKVVCGRDTKERIPEEAGNRGKNVLGVLNGCQWAVELKYEQGAALHRCILPLF